ncbi:hypothetical protein CAEBREN_00812 [Caenorhabditis brenneri]|uniref:SPK domain-containing protein n=1 Tax=Caenorhabditis brenneri TaxID=135651 RepID=G0MAM5_CAEBE|nr:hypothetical protein CAEBREN_00812 [Caenorhabditis brenneri]
MLIGRQVFANKYISIDTHLKNKKKAEMKLSKSEQRKKDEDLLDNLMIRVRNRSTPISHREVGQVLLKKRVVAHIQIVSRRMHQMVQILEESAKYDSVAKAKFLFVLSYPFECDRDIKEEIMNAGDPKWSDLFRRNSEKGKARGQNQMARSRKLRTARNAAQRRRKIDGRVKNRLPPKVRRGRINDDTQELDTGDEDVEMDARPPSVSIGAANRGRESDNDSDVDANQMGLDGEEQSVPHARNGENSDSNHSEPSDNVDALDFDDYEMASEWENRERSVSPIRNDAGQRRAEELDEDDEIRLDQSFEQRKSRKWHLDLNALLYSITEWLQSLEPENDWKDLLQVFRKVEEIPIIGSRLWQIVVEELHQVEEDRKISIDAIDMFVQCFSADLCDGIEGIYD